MEVPVSCFYNEEGKPRAICTGDTLFIEMWEDLNLAPESNSRIDSKIFLQVHLYDVARIKIMPLPIT